MKIGKDSKKFLSLSLSPWALGTICFIFGFSDVGIIFFIYGFICMMYVVSWISNGWLED